METALRVVHLLAATVWVGGTVALVFVTVPMIQRLPGEERARLLRDLGRRWRPLGWSALGVAIVTGAALAGMEHAFDTTPTSFDAVLAAKGGLVGALVAGAYLHDYVVGPGLARQIREGGPQTRRPFLTWLGRTNLLITLALPVLGVVLSQLLPE